jgi:hypothetical protein
MGWKLFWGADSDSDGRRRWTGTPEADAVGTQPTRRAARVGWVPAIGAISDR